MQTTGRMQAGSDGLGKADISDVAMDSDKDTELTPQWVLSGHRLISGLLGLNVMLFGAALVAGNVLNPAGLQHQEPELFLLVLMVLSMLWMLWYLLWARRQDGTPPHKDHHAGSTIVMVVLMLFAGFSLLLCVFLMGYYLLLKECQPLVKILSPFIQAPFFTLQTFLLWTHSKDCIHRHQVLNRFGLMLTLSADVLLWLCAVTDDSIHSEKELEKQNNTDINSTFSLHTPLEAKAGQEDVPLCQCSTTAVCVAFQKGYEILYPFNMEFSLLAGCMLYIMWKNVGRHMENIHAEHVQKNSLRSVLCGGVLLGPLLGILVLLTGATVFVLYHTLVGQSAKRLTAFMLFYGFHLSLMPIMTLCSLAGLMVQKVTFHKHGMQCDEQNQMKQKSGHGVEMQGQSKNPTKSLDVVLLLGTAVGQLFLSYLSIVAALALGPGDIVSNLDLSYSLLSLVELVLQNIFIIRGMHLHTHAHINLHKYRQSDTHLHIHSSVKTSKEDNVFSMAGQEVDPANGEQLQEKSDTSIIPADREYNHHWSRKMIQEIYAFLVLSNITLWVIPAFGAHPELESGLGKQFFGFSVWFVLVNLSQPLTVFYRMHSVGALMELLISA